MKTAIDHINIVVADMERSVWFYSTVLGLQRGFEVILEGEWIETVTGLPDVLAHCVFMESSDATVRLELLQYLMPTGEMLPSNRLPNTSGLRHLAFTVDNIDVLIERLREAGVLPISEPVTVPFMVGTMGRKRLFYFHDPDGTLLEAAAYEAIS